MLAMEDIEEEILYDRTGLLSHETKHQDIEWNDSKYKTGWNRVWVTVGLCGAFFGLGLCYAIPGPTLLDLQLQTDVNLEEISSIFTGRSLGYLVGSLVGGIMFDKINGLLLLSFALFMAAAATVIAPLSKHFMLLLALIGLQGASMGVMDTGGNVMILDTWGRKSAPYMQGMHFLFGLGAFVAPLISEPFLGKLTNRSTTDHIAFMPTSAQPVALNLMASTIPDHRIRFARDVSQTHESWMTTTVSTGDDNGNVSSTTIPPELKKPAKTGASGAINPSSEVAGGTDLGQRLKDNQMKAQQQQTSASNSSTPQPDTHNDTVLTTSDIPTTVITTTIKALATSSSKPVVATDVTGDEGTNTDLDNNDTQAILANVTTKVDTPSIKEVMDDIKDQIKNMNQVQFAFLIIGAFLGLMSLVFLGLCCRGQKTCFSVRISRIEERYSFAPESKGFRIQILALLFVFYFMYMGIYVTFGGFILTFAVKYLKWTQEKGALLTSVFWGAFASGRGFAIFLSKWLSPNVMIVGDIALMCFSLAGLMMSLESNENVIWFFTATLGLGMASVFPTGITWAERYMHITGTSTSVFTVASALGEMSFPILTGVAFQIKGPMWLMYVSLAACIVCAVLLVFMQNLALNAGERYEKLTHFLGRAPHECDDFELDSVSCCSGSQDGYSRNAVTNGYKRVTFNIPNDSKPKKGKFTSATDLKTD